jgi:hypothetical protein
MRARSAGNSLGEHCSNVTVELGTETFQAQATPVVEEPLRSELFAKVVEHMPGFADYEKKTSRKIPAIVLERVE